MLCRSPIGQGWLGSLPIISSPSALKTIPNPKRRTSPSALALPLAPMAPRSPSGSATSRSHLSRAAIRPASHRRTLFRSERLCRHQHQLELPHAAMGQQHRVDQDHWPRLRRNLPQPQFRRRLHRAQFKPVEPAPELCQQYVELQHALLRVLIDKEKGPVFHRAFFLSGGGGDAQAIP